jgi:DNA invertase Pin-like site-specific DNA recombinase
MEREKASQRTHDAMLRKARSGYVTGGKSYGYDNIDVHGDARGIDGERQRLHVVRRINQGEALVVRRLFERYASGGYGLRALTKELNAEDILPPTKHRKGWAPSCIREILHRELYRGVVI